MVPVRLELQNFLSYGTDAPALDFEQFDVACLSGGNGEGKSALLDAITWAVWGEARKSSGKRKPDDELIRIGSRHMEVAFTFDLADTRYRVTRSFSRSETGKTTSSDLEFQLYDPDEATYRPLTGATQRETQARIEETLGLDYDTFINSAFLLQGRSDEFTNKSPSQRKEILVSILNLSRYEALEDRARDRWRDAKHRQQRLEAEVDRLQDAIADVPEWTDRQAELESDLETKQDRLRTLRVREKELTQSLANLEAKAREADSVASAIDDLEARISEQEADRSALEERIADADEVLEDEDAIEAAYERYQALQDERDTLDEQRDRHRALEKELEQKKATLRRKTNELERRLDRLTVERKQYKESLAECEATLEQRPAVEAKLRAAQAARQQMAEWETLRDRRQRLANRQAEARRALVGKRQQLRGELDTLQKQLAEEREAADSLATVEDRIAALEEKADERERLTEEMNRIEREGTSLAETIQERAGQLEARREEREREVAELRRFRTAEGPTCPTCGTELTPEHRAEVESTLQSSIDELTRSIEAGESRLQELEERRSALREEYAARRSEREELGGVAEALTTAREQKRALKERIEARDEHAERVDRLRRRLEEGTYGAEERRRWQWCAQRRADLQFDADRLDTLQNRAAQVDRYADRLRELDAQADRRETLAEKIRAHDEEIESLRTTLSDGSAFDELRDRIEALGAQLEDLNFDPDRFQAVRDELDELSDVPDRMSDLRHARSNREDWMKQMTRIEDRLEGLRSDRRKKTERLEELKTELEEKDALEAEIAELESAVAAAEETVSEAQQALGKLEERLDQAERDRKALQATKEDLEDCAEQRRLYKHLRTAFGKHGIPSLIIEETLPEIEQRANDILHRLTDARMHVRLDTLKKKKSGGTKETLDIIITDEQGVARPYETYSGGESFRVNFALRVALAQLLAERSGVRVRTLVIDEGFGTQDEEGIARLVDAIQEIRQDFAKILVITHLPRLKEAFPVRVEVEKDPVVGSTFEVVTA
ncbi:MAG: AAA family ATPase [Salinibacter sp.]